MVETTETQTQVRSIEENMSTPEFLDLIWGDRESYVDVPSKARTYWIPWIAEWPEQRDQIIARIDECERYEEDVYFSVAQFSEKGRRVQDTLPTHWLWADLDTVDPVYLDEDGVLPTLAWESSFGRYQALWLLDRELDPEIQTKLNRRLSLAIGADKGGWDLTQVLRPIDTLNFKYSVPFDVELLWYDEDLVYGAREMLDRIKAIEGGKPRAQRHERVETGEIEFSSLPARVRRLLRTPEEMVVVGERSHQLWILERELAKAGVTEEQAFSLVWPCAWNKHREVRTGEQRLRTEIAKAMASVADEARAKERKERDRVAEAEAAVEEPEEPRAPRVVSPFVPYANFLSQPIVTPRWLIENIWSGSSHGIIGGEPKTSKSTFTLAMALSVATGKPFLGIEEFQVPSPGPVLLVQEENAPWVVQDRLKKLAHLYGLLPTREVEFIKAPKGSIAKEIARIEFPADVDLHLMNNYGFNLTEEEDRHLLEDKVAEVGAKMVIIDPLYLVMGDTNLNASHELGPHLQWLMALRYNYDCAVAIVHHWSKVSEWSTQRRAGQRLMGSAFFHGWLESGLYMENIDSAEGIVTVRVEREFRNVAPQDSLEIMWKLGEPGALDLDVGMVAWNPLHDLQKVLERLFGLDGDIPISAKTIAMEMGLNEKDPAVKRKIAMEAKELGYNTKRRKYPQGYGWEIEQNGLVHAT